MGLKATLFLCFILGAAALKSQGLINQLIALEADSEANPEALEQTNQSLYEILDRPISVNFSSREEFMQSGLLDIFQVHNLMQYRERYGLIYSAKELIVVKGFSVKFIKKLAPYLNFSTLEIKLNLAWQDIWQRNKQEILWRIQGAKDAQPLKENYNGDALESRFRYQLKARNGLRIALNMQKDLGEKWWTAQGPDHCSGFIDFRGNGRTKQLLIGDFQFNFGQGLSLWSGSAMDVQSLTSGLKRNPTGLSAFAGNEENRFFRGLAAVFQTHQWQLQVFLAQRKLDARLEGEDGTAFKLISGGLHRIASELERKNKVKLRSAGLMLNYNSNLGTIGLLCHGHHFNLIPISPERLYEALAPIKQQYLLGSIQYNLLLKGFHLFGELALDQNRHTRLYFAWRKKWTERIRIKQAIRHFSPNYQGHWSSANAISGSSGEWGLEHRFDYLWDYHQQSMLRWDYCQIPWPRYQINGPSSGQDITMIHQLAKGRNSYHLRFRYQQKKEQFLKEDADAVIRKNESYFLRFRVDTQLSTAVKIRAEVQQSWMPLEEHWYSGLLVRQEIKIRWNNSWRSNFSVALSQIDDLAPAMYAYEKDLLYNFSIPRYSGKTIRISTYTSYKREHWLFEFKIFYQWQAALNSWDIGLKAQMKYSFQKP